MKKGYLLALLSLMLFTGCNQEEKQIVDSFNAANPIMCQHSIQTPVIINNKNWNYSSEFKKFYNGNNTFSLTECQSAK